MVVTHALKTGQLSAEEVTKSEGHFQSSSGGAVCSEKIQMKRKKNHHGIIDP